MCNKPHWNSGRSFSVKMRETFYETTEALQADLDA